MIRLGLFVRVFGIDYASALTGLSVRYFDFMLFVIRNVQARFVCPCVWIDYTIGILAGRVSCL